MNRMHIIIFAFTSILAVSTFQFVATAQDKQPIVKSSFTVDFLVDRANTIRKAYDDAHANGENVFVTTKATVENVKKAAELWETRALNMTSKQELSLDEETRLAIAKIRISTIIMTTKTWHEVAANRPQSRHADAADQFEDAVKWHRPAFESKTGGREEAAARIILEAVNDLDLEWDAFRKAYRPEATTTTEILDQRGLLKWALIKDDITCRAYRAGHVLWQLHLRVAVLGADILVHADKLKPETKSAIEEKIKALEGRAKEFGVLYAPEPEAKK